MTQATVYSDSAERPGVVIVGAGDYARYLVEVAEKKRFPINAAFKRAGKKIGEDLGIACGMGREIGIKLEDTKSIAPGAPRAQVALVAAASSLIENFETYCLLLEGGYNVLCLAPEAFHPYFFDPETAGEIDAIAKANAVTFTGGGIWDMSRIWAGILATGPCSEIRRLSTPVRPMWDVRFSLLKMSVVIGWPLAFRLMISGTKGTTSIRPAPTTP